MKTLRNIYNQIGFVFVVVVAILLYKHIIELDWPTGISIALIIIAILALGKIIPSKK